MSFMQDKSSTNVWLVEGDQELRCTVKRLFNSRARVQCPIDFNSCEAAIEFIDMYRNRLQPYSNPEVLLLDIDLPGMDGIHGMHLLKQRLPDTQIIMHTSREDLNSIYQAFQAGASGYLLKNSNYNTIIDAIQQAVKGGIPMSAQIAQKAREFFKTENKRPLIIALERREGEVLEQVAVGYTKYA